ncbi:hypothetical protein I4641_00085 [Waterburya agarophytonicola K14]|uniref:Uncharacterized protein n=1 Tax=Waterburya agarophytonicola KI4 TaxID=2874699 RepID=A0A964FFE2_9CYAN|nr:hypothetical protein [Waterburya agarophytonicola]MCC0175378.1 hypothetical protein [Waterburya agarophytonicola KI4]
MQEPNLDNTSRPVAKNHLEIGDTFQDAGTRPIEQSPDFLVSKEENIDNIDRQNISRKKIVRKINRNPPLD